MGALFRLVALALGALIVVHLAGLDIGAAYAALLRKLDRAVTDAGKLASGEYMQAPSPGSAMAASAPLPEDTVKPADASEEVALSRELTTERKRVLSERVAATERVVGNVFSGDVQALRRQAEQNARGLAAAAAAE